MTQPFEAQLSSCLQNAHSGDKATRETAETFLRQAEQENWGAYIHGLAHELANEGSAEAGRQMAGLLLKNALDAKDSVVQVRRRSSRAAPAAYVRLEQLFRLTGGLRGAGAEVAEVAGPGGPRQGADPNGPPQHAGQPGARPRPVLHHTHHVSLLFRCRPRCAPHTVLLGQEPRAHSGRATTTPPLATPHPLPPRSHSATVRVASSVFLPFGAQD